MEDLVLVQHALSGSFLSSEMGHLLWVDVDFSAPFFLSLIRFLMNCSCELVMIT